MDRIAEVIGVAVIATPLWLIAGILISLNCRLRGVNLFGLGLDIMNLINARKEERPRRARGT